ncbi:MAG: OsmC family protein [Candidatus Limnocylindrales bacterium]
MGQQEVRQAIAGAIDFLANNRADAKYTDSPATARLDDLDALTVTVDGPSGAHISTDMPTSVGGTNTTASPGWYLRAAEASCVATLIAMRAAHLGVKLTNLEVMVDSESDDWGILGVGDDRGEKVAAGPLTTRVAVKITAADADASTHSDLQALVHWAVDHCPVTDAVRRAVPMTIEVDTQ